MEEEKSEKEEVGDKDERRGSKQFKTLYIYIQK